jgi:uracil-DNA glycosylase
MAKADFPKPSGQAKPPPQDDVQKLKRAAKRCRVCPFARQATQTVFGQGLAGARLMLVGEQPGNQEDIAGEPFVGPAGKLLAELLDELGIPREQAYVTNAVKHFKYVRKGKIRLHAKPNAAEINACRPWLDSEIRAVKPAVILALGATAAGSLCGNVKIQANRGKALQLRKELTGTQPVFVSWHPSAILRAPDERGRSKMRNELKEDLLNAWSKARSRPK